MPPPKPTPSLAATTRPRRGSARNVGVTVLWRYSPVMMSTPSTSARSRELSSTEKTFVNHWEEPWGTMPAGAAVTTAGGEGEGEAEREVDHHHDAEEDIRRPDGPELADLGTEQPDHHGSPIGPAGDAGDRAVAVRP